MNGNTTGSLTDMTRATLQTGQIDQDLEEGCLYVVRKGKLIQVPRNDEEGMRRLRVTEEAYQKAMDIGHQMRRDLGGYKPDVSLVVSAILLGGLDEMRARETVRQFVLRMFSATLTEGQETAPGVEPQPFSIEED